MEENSCELSIQIKVKGNSIYERNMGMDIENLEDIEVTEIRNAIKDKLDSVLRDLHPQILTSLKELSKVKTDLIKSKGDLLDLENQMADVKSNDSPIEPEGEPICAPDQIDIDHESFVISLTGPLRGEKSIILQNTLKNLEISYSSEESMCVQKFKIPIIEKSKVRFKPYTWEGIPPELATKIKEVLSSLMLGVKDSVHF